MPVRIPLSCACAEVQGSLVGNPGPRLNCWCDSCQQAAAWLEAQQPGSTRRTWLANGATDAFQCFRQQLQISQGKHRIAAFKLETSSPTQRFYTRCCHTLISAAPEKPQVLPITPVFAGFFRNPEQIAALEVNYRVFATRRADGEDSPRPGGLHWPFLLHTLTRVATGYACARFQPNPFAFLRDQSPVLAGSSAPPP